jgi:hypothetical protein
MEWAGWKSLIWTCGGAAMFLRGLGTPPEEAYVTLFFPSMINKEW